MWVFFFFFDFFQPEGKKLGFFFFFFFFLVCDPNLILQISGTFQQTCRKLHRKTEEADNAVKVVLS